MPVRVRDPAIRHLGDLVHHAAAKDTPINEQNCRVYGVLDDRFTRIPAGENPVGLGGKNTLTRWPAKEDEPALRNLQQGSP